MDLKPIAKTMAKSSDSALAKLVERLVADEVKSPHAKLLIARLTKGALAVASKAGATISERLLQSTGDLFKLSEALAQRRSGFSHLFGDALAKARVNPSRTSYLRVVDDVGDLIKSPEAKAAIENAAVRKSVEGLRNQLVENIGAGVFESYSDLRRETRALNALNLALTPGDYPGVRFDAHHLIEDRTYEKFAKDWKMLGWNSADDMMASAVPSESHIRSSASKKGLPGFEDRPEALTSLTKRLQDEIPLDKYTSADDLIDAYVAFYRRPTMYKGKSVLGSQLTERIVATLKATKHELGVARTRANLLAKAAKKP
jgi:hypothetical protein